MSKPRRILSIDIFRGITIAMMIIVNNPGSWAYVYAPLRHAKWHGCTPTDLVFPFFLFIVGAAMRFAFVRWHSFASNEFYKHVFIRTLSIFIAGSFIHAFPFIQQDWDWSNYRIMGVLQRIALAYGIAAIMVIHLDLKKIFISSIGILLASSAASDVYKRQMPFCMPKRWVYICPAPRIIHNNHHCNCDTSKNINR